MKKIISALLALALLGGLALTGCGNKPESEAAVSEAEGTQAIDLPEEEDEVEELATGDALTFSDPTASAEAAAVSFANAIMAGDYAAALELSFLPEGAFVFAEDIEWYLPRSDYKELLDYTGGIVTGAEPADGGSAATVVLSLASEDGAKQGSVTIDTLMDNSNDWKTNISDFYITDWYIEAPGGKTVLAVNGVEVGSEYISTSSGALQLMNTYILPAVGKQEKTLSLTLDEKFGTYEEAILPPERSNANDCTSLYYYIEGDEETEALNAVMDTWNTLIQLYEEGAEASEALEYIASDANSSVATDIWEYFGKMTETAASTYVGFEMYEIASRENMPSYLITDCVAGINLSYRSKWTRVMNHGTETPMEMSYLASIAMKYEDGAYKIYQVSDSKLFTWANPNSSEW